MSEGTFSIKSVESAKEAYSIYFDLRDKGDIDDARRWLILAQTLSDQRRREEYPDCCCSDCEEDDE